MELWLRLVLLLSGIIIFIFIILENYKQHKKFKQLSDNKSFTMPVIAAETNAQAIIEKKSKKDKKAVLTSKIITMHIMSRDNKGFSGMKLLAVLRTVQNKYGGLQIFQRKMADNIDPLFYVASAIEPGYLDLDKIEDFSTPGITLFFTLEDSERSTVAYELMLQTGEYIACRLNGELLDQDRRALTKDSIEKYRLDIIQYGQQEDVV